jgi:hypothetical protein
VTDPSGPPYRGAILPDGTRTVEHLLGARERKNLEHPPRPCPVGTSGGGASPDRSGRIDRRGDGSGGVVASRTLPEAGPAPSHPATRATHRCINQLILFR